MTVIVDKIGEVVASMRNLSAAEAEKLGIDAGLESPYYFYGHPVDINNQMIQRDKGTTKGKVYPAIALRLPTTEDVYGGMIHYNLNLAIFALTDLDKTAPERYEEVIKPILYPLYKLLLDRIKRAGFMWDGNMRYPPHTKIDRPHYGVNETQGNKAYVFENKLEAIELINLKINYKFKSC